jgi:hypothetical protein
VEYKILQNAIAILAAISLGENLIKNVPKRFSMLTHTKTG